MTMQTEKDRMTAKQVAAILGFTITNLKHYASLLELNGLELFRNTRNHREYTEQDVKILRAMQRLNREKSMSLDDAASFVMSSDTDIDAIFSQSSEYIDANASEVEREVSQELDVPSIQASQYLASLSQQFEQISLLREQLEARDQLSLTFQSEISKQLDEQSATIQELRKELLEMKEVKPSFLSRIFGK